VTDAGLVPWADEQQTGEFALCAGGRLQRCRGRAGDLAEDPFQVGEEGEPTLDLVVGLRRVAQREAGHGGGGVAQLRVVLHGAGSERVGAVIHRVVA
jgi:hypothetical protein